MKYAVWDNFIFKGSMVSPRKICKIYIYRDAISDVILGVTFGYEGEASIVTNCAWDLRLKSFFQAFFRPFSVIHIFVVRLGFRRRLYRVHIIRCCLCRVYIFSQLWMSRVHRPMFVYESSSQCSEWHANVIHAIGACDWISPVNTEITRSHHEMR